MSCRVPRRDGDASIFIPVPLHSSFLNSSFDIFPNMAAKKTTLRNTRPRELLFGDLWEYDPAPESAEPFIEKRYGLFIDGKFSAPKSKKYFDSIAPRNGEKLSEIAMANAADVDAAYAAAAKAFPAWSK